MCGYEDLFLKRFVPVPPREIVMFSFPPLSALCLAFSDMPAPPCRDRLGYAPENSRYVPFIFHTRDFVRRFPPVQSTCSLVPKRDRCCRDRAARLLICVFGDASALISL